MILRVEYILYVYMMVCLAMLLFHFIYTFYDPIKQRRIQKKALYYVSIIQRHFKASDINKKKMNKMIMKKLSRLHEIIAYYEAVLILHGQDDRRIQIYLQENVPLFQKLASVYLKKDAMHRAYYADLMKRFHVISHFNFSVLAEILLQYFDQSTIFCRENVLQAFYRFGNSKIIITAFQYLNDHEIFHHDKLLSDGLMQFQGDKEELAVRLWKFHKRWSESNVLAIINFIRLAKLDFRIIFYNLIKDHQASQEIRLAVIRYFRTNHYAPIEACLHEIVQQESSIMANVACLALSNYPSEKTKRILKQALCNSNWYVRQNAAISFLQLQPSVHELDDILNGHDHYAKDMLIYQMQKMNREVQ